MCFWLFLACWLGQVQLACPHHHTRALNLASGSAEPAFWTFLENQSLILSLLRSLGSLRCDAVPDFQEVYPSLSCPGHNLVSFIHSHENHEYPTTWNTLPPSGSRCPPPSQRPWPLRGVAHVTATAAIVQMACLTTGIVLLWVPLAL